MKNKTKKPKKKTIIFTTPDDKHKVVKVTSSTNKRGEKIFSFKDYQTKVTVYFTEESAGTLFDFIEDHLYGSP